MRLPLAAAKILAVLLLALPGFADENPLLEALESGDTQAAPSALGNPQAAAGIESQAQCGASRPGDILCDPQGELNGFNVADACSDVQGVKLAEVLLKCCPNKMGDKQAEKRSLQYTWFCLNRPGGCKTGAMGPGRGEAEAAKDKEAEKKMAAINPQGRSLHELQARAGQRFKLYCDKSLSEAPQRKESAFEADERRLLASKEYHWGPVVWDNCRSDMICQEGSMAGKITKSDMVVLYKEACTMLRKAQTFFESTPGTSDKMTGFLKIWLKNFESRDGLSFNNAHAVRFKRILGNSWRKCRSGIQFECNTCTETSTSFKITGNPNWIQTFNTDVQTCPGLCSRTRDLVRINLIHEITHYGGAADDDKVSALMPDTFQGMIPEMAAEYDKSRR